MIKKSLLFFGLYFVFLYSSKAQSPLSLYYLENVPQSTKVNPAMAPRANVFVGMPGVNSIYAGFKTDILGPNLFQKVDGNYLSPLKVGYDFSKLNKRIGKVANFNSYQSIAPLTFGFSGKKGYFTFTWSEKLNQSVAIPKDFFSIIDKTLPDNSKFDLSSLALGIEYYRELSFGYSYNFMNKLRVGIHAKLLQGIAAVKTDIKKFDLDVSRDSDNRHAEYNMDFASDIYMSAPIDVPTNSNGFPSGIDLADMNTALILKQGFFNFSNPGFAIDLGAKYEYNEEWTFSGSINDLGFIKWNGNLHSFSANGEFHYKGLELDGEDLEDMGNAMSNLVDSIIQGVNVQVSDKGFSTGLKPKVYLSAQYKLNYYLSFGGLSRTTFGKNNFNQEFNVSTNLNLYRFLTTTINYTLATNGANTIGFGFALTGGPMQFYFVADYLPYTYRSLSIVKNGSESKIPFVPKRLDNFNVMLGLNILVGANGFRDEPMIDAYSEY
ncbi:MAG: DUF5723 family protein [Salinivirgaceae bacterium]|jgi:hypothetical protein|nr:DUF5723 family protein [Salinivirgaceae bacterium]